MNDNILEYAVSIAANNMEELLEINKQLSSIIPDESGSIDVNMVSNILNTALGVREKIIEILQKVEEYLSQAESISRDIAWDLYSITGYYVWGGYKTDKNSITRYSKYLDIAPSMKSIEALYSIAKRIHDLLHASLH